eukprot:TRINITY_DN9799_c0_g1_i4.p1 TRINITY_DN9799_c0_g1~~TRINITY_DN9799_c0_g1_i4.p1  ORF type:complete len:217 (-),score=71.43 TRINITY_DN9799_c0_g1_i4:41-691(-)
MLKELVDKSSEIDQAILMRFPPFLVDQIKSLPHDNLNIKVRPTNDIDMRFFRVQINENEYPATLVDLPTIIEAHKTLDYKTIFKSVDVGQMLLVHQLPPGISIEDFDPFVHDSSFASMVVDATGAGRFKLKSGITPAAHNVTLSRHKQKFSEEPDDVEQVELSLKQIIDTGFSDNVEEELLVFDTRTGELLDEENAGQYVEAVSYTHLTLPTKRIV